MVLAGRTTGISLSLLAGPAEMVGEDGVAFAHNLLNAGFRDHLGSVDGRLRGEVVETL
jgi:hypothetical protein